MPAVFKTIVVFFVFSGCTFLSACGEPPIEIALQLLRSSDATYATPQALKIVVRDVDQASPEVFGPFNIDRSDRTRLSAGLTAGARFFVDVSACASTDACGDDDRLARGCSGIERVVSSDAFSMTIALSDADSEAARQCPSF